MTIDWNTRIITIFKTDMTKVQSVPFEIYELDIMHFKEVMADMLDNVDGIVYPDIFRHNSAVTISGTNLIDVVEIINGYTLLFENGNYAVNLVGANSNLGDKVNLNGVSVRSANSAGLIVKRIGSGLSQEEHDKLFSVPTSNENADSVWNHTDRLVTNPEISQIPDINSKVDTLVLEMLPGWEADVVNKQMIYFDHSGNIIAKFNCYDENGNPSMQKIRKMEFVP